jgi:mannosyltransferase OCH1-like enzyme
VERTCCCSNHITRLVIKPTVVLPWFLAYLFNAIRSTGYFGLIATNFVNQAGINTETLSALRLPIPDLNTQREIVDDLHRHRLEARRLREEATREWEKAEARFEAKLLGEGTTRGFETGRHGLEARATKQRP